MWIKIQNGLSLDIIPRKQYKKIRGQHCPKKGPNPFQPADQTNGKVYSRCSIADELSHQTHRRGYWLQHSNCCEKRLLVKFQLRARNEPEGWYAHCNAGHQRSPCSPCGRCVRQVVWSCRVANDVKKVRPLKKLTIPQAMLPLTRWHCLCIFPKKVYILLILLNLITSKIRSLHTDTYCKVRRGVTGEPGAKSSRCSDFVISFIKLNFIN